jgi:hypothetical protein
MSQQSSKGVGSVTVSEGVLKQADRCHRKHSCLQADTRQCCKVLDSVGHGIIFVQPERDTCPYKVSFGLAHKLCSCPVRSELHRNHQV